MCMADYSDPPRVWSEGYVLAKGNHICEECGRTILGGEMYIRHFGVTAYGDSYSGKTCEHCRVMMDWLGAECGGWLYTRVLEDFQGHARDYRRSDLARIAVAARRRWKRFRPERFAFPGMPVPKMPRGLKLGDAHV